MKMQSRTTTAFTLVELLVVISMIAVLIGILLPALAAAKQQARMIREMAASRQLSQAYLGYALDHRGQLLPSYLGGNDVTATDGRGNTFGGPSDFFGREAARRYPWRLVAYIDHGIQGSILVNEQAKALADPPANAAASDLNAWRYNVSLYPSLGLNQSYLGGDTPQHLQQLTQAVQPSRMIAFGSARQTTSTGVKYGYFEIAAPHSPSGDWFDEYDENNAPVLWGWVHPRWNNRAVATHLDGHSELLDMQQMRDMTRWSNAAAVAGDPNWSPTSP